MSTKTVTKSAEYWIRKLGLKPHPEGGYYRETYRSDERIISGLPERFSGKRSFSTAIYFLLNRKNVSRFHKLKSDELWHFYAGSPLTIHIISPSGEYSEIELGPNPNKKQNFQCVIKRNHWFGAIVNNGKGFTLVGCTVAPGFDFSDFELASREELISLCPGRKAIIEKLTQ